MRTTTQPKEAGNLTRTIAPPGGGVDPQNDNLALTEQLAAVLDDIRANQAEQAELLASIQRSLRHLRRQK